MKRLLLPPALLATVCCLSLPLMGKFAASAEPAVEPSAARAAFDQAFADYKQMVREIEDLRIEYQTASEARRKEINEQFPQLIAGGQKKVDAMIAEALKLYQAAPESDPKVSELLYTVAQHKLVGSGQNSQGGDQFEQAFEIVQALLAGGNQSEGLATMGVISAFCTNHYDQAEQYAAMATERKEKASFLGADLLDKAATFGSPQMLEEYRSYWQRESELREAEAKADDLPRIKFETTKGDIVLELFENEAPIAVANMVTLVKDGFYDDVIFHRVLPHFMAQGGDPKGTGSGGPGYSIRCECQEEDARMHFRGSLSMAHAGRNTGGSQFFLTFVPTFHLNGQHTVFGRVVEGMEVLGELQRINPGEPGVTPDKIKKATVIRDRGHQYEVEKLPAR